jgi:hypothetical protein
MTEVTIFADRDDNFLLAFYWALISIPQVLGFIFD